MFVLALHEWIQHVGIYFAMTVPLAAVAAGVVGITRTHMKDELIGTMDTLIDTVREQATADEAAALKRISALEAKVEIMQKEFADVIAESVSKRLEDVIRLAADRAVVRR